MSRTYGILCLSPKDEFVLSKSLQYLKILQLADGYCGYRADGQWRTGQVAARPHLCLEMHKGSMVAGMGQATNEYSPGRNTGVQRLENTCAHQLVRDGRDRTVRITMLQMD